MPYRAGEDAVRVAELDALVEVRERLQCGSCTETLSSKCVETSR